MSTTTQPSTLAEIREVLNIDTRGLSRDERYQLWKLSQQLTDRTTCELWGHGMGWEIPAYGTAEWRELQSAWLNSNDWQQNTDRE